MIQTVCDFCHRTIDTDRKYGEITLHDFSLGAIHNSILELDKLHICNDCLEKYRGPNEQEQFR